MNLPPDSEVRRVRAHGLVQGVGFRESCVAYARANGVAGWVRNRGDGSVEAMLQGPPALLDRMCDWLRHEVPGARVDALDVRPEAAPVEPSSGFERRPTL
ncbi:acylphosphatase [Variovorax sp. LARHSF232]